MPDAFAPARWDIFISHASEDKAVVARPLAERLIAAGLSVWCDEFTLRAGDSLRQSIDHGIANSRYGLVILSTAFFGRKWTEAELSALIAREHGAKIIVPIWYDVTEQVVRENSPILADRYAIQFTAGLDVITREILRAINLPFGKPAAIEGTWAGKSGRLRLFEVQELIEGDYDWNGHDWAAHLRGRLSGDILTFDWWWDLTHERGGGFFKVGWNSLVGEWWLGQDRFGSPILRNHYNLARHDWQFQRI